MNSNKVLDIISQLIFVIIVSIVIVETIVKLLEYNNISIWQTITMLIGITIFFGIVDYICFIQKKK